MSINIETIRKITRESRRGPAIGEFITILDLAINSAARRGKNSIDPHAAFSGLSCRSPSPEEWEAIQQYYVGKGFIWRNHPDPDPGHPASRSYTTLSW